MTETAKVFHRNRGRRGHFWERRYRACVVEDDAYALAALRYLDRNPVRAGLGDDAAAYPWSSCATYALVAPSGEVVADGRDPRWTMQRAVGSPAFVAQYAPHRRGRPRVGPMPSSNQEVAR